MRQRQRRWTARRATAGLLLLVAVAAAGLVPGRATRAEEAAATAEPLLTLEELVAAKAAGRTETELLVMIVGRKVPAVPLTPAAVDQLRGRGLTDPVIGRWALAAGSALHGQKKFQDAMGQYDLAESLAPALAAELALLRSSVHGDHGDLPRALETLTDGIGRLSAGSPADLRYMLTMARGSLLTRAARYPEAVADLTACLASPPPGAPVEAPLTTLALIRAACPDDAVRDPAAALALFQQILALQKARGRTPTWQEVRLAAIIKAAGNDFDAAVRLLETIVPRLGEADKPAVAALLDQFRAKTPFRLPAPTATAAPGPAAPEPATPRPHTAPGPSTAPSPPATPSVPAPAPAATPPGPAGPATPAPPPARPEMLGDPIVAGIAELIERDMVRVPGGTFAMGRAHPLAPAHEGPVHDVTVRPFYLSQFEVTRQLWEVVMYGDLSRVAGLPESGLDPRMPVENVSSQDVGLFLDRLNRMAGTPGLFRLPTEAEWEFAARFAPEGATVPEAYDDARPPVDPSPSDAGQALPDWLAEAAWLEGNSGGTAHRVGEKTPNPLGLYDMLGNVAEWVSDRYGTYPAGPQQDPTGPDTGFLRVCRGGSWANTSELVRVTTRAPCPPADRRRGLGFRLATSAPPADAPWPMKARPAPAAAASEPPSPATSGPDPGRPAPTGPTTSGPAAPGTESPGIDATPAGSEGPTPVERTLPDLATQDAAVQAADAAYLAAPGDTKLGQALYDAIFLRFVIHYKDGRFAEAVADLNRIGERLLTTLDTGTRREILLALAWIEATCPEASVRNGSEAVSLAQVAGAIAHWDEFVDYRVYAAAKAEAGDFAKAVQVAQRALKRAPPQFTDVIKAELASYQAGRPVRSTKPPLVP